MHENRLYERATMAQLSKHNYVSREEKRQLRKMARGDVKKVRKIMEEKYYSSDESIMELEDKIYYHSDSSADIADAIEALSPMKNGKEGSPKK